MRNDKLLDIDDEAGQLSRDCNKLKLLFDVVCDRYFIKPKIEANAEWWWIDSYKNLQPLIDLVHDKMIEINMKSESLANEITKLYEISNLKIVS